VLWPLKNFLTTTLATTLLLCGTPYVLAQTKVVPQTPVNNAPIDSIVKSDDALDDVDITKEKSPDLSDLDEAKDLKSLADKLENWGRIYQNDDNPLLQEWWLLGRYHGQYHDSDGNIGNHDGWEDRRFRIGSQAQFFDKLTLHAQMVSGSDFEPFYNGFTELWSQWEFEDYLVLSVGQQKHRFTHDRNVSSRYMNTLERGMLLNMFAADYTPAVTLSGSTDSFRYYSGIFSNATGRDMVDSFTNFDSGHSLLASGTWDLDSLCSTDTAFLNLCYLHSDFNANATNLNRFQDGISSALILTEGAGSLITEGLIGLHSDDGDAYGINVQPGYFFTEKLQLATRYQLAIASEENGLVSQRRYERPAGMTTGDLYQAGYVGLNYHIAGHRIKLMNGLEYSDLSGQNLWTASFAVRIFWGPNASGPFPTAATLSPD